MVIPNNSSILNIIVRSCFLDFIDVMCLFCQLMRCTCYDIVECCVCIILANLWLKHLSSCIS